ncbi:MAG: tyrosine-type recombinase/integrase [Pyrinomonadaceae bacterium]
MARASIKRRKIQRHVQLVYGTAYAPANARVAAKIVDFRFHDLRHTAATRLADAKANIVVIAEILGHGDIRTTKRYSHAMDEAKREAVEKLAGTGAGGQNPAKKARKEKRQAGRLTVS